MSKVTSLLTDEAMTFIGKEGPPVQGYPVAEHEIRRFCYAIDDLNPRYLDPAYAAATPAKGIVAPPLFVGIPFDRLDVPLSELRKDGVPASPEGSLMPPIRAERQLAGGIELEFFTEVRPGDVLTLRTKITDIYERAGKSGPMVFIIQETTYTNQRGDKVAIERMTRISR
ncbi:MAG: MaoC family dehydratase N-terminal domain-containing protein [Candidatus Binatia bacterium]